MRREASGGWIIQRSEPQFTIGGLRDFLNRESQGNISPALGKKITDGGYSSLTDAEEWEAMLGISGINNFR